MKNSNIFIKHNTFESVICEMVAQTVIWTNAGILLIGPLGTNFSEILIKKFLYFHSRKHISNCRQEIGGHFVSASMC